MCLDDPVKGEEGEHLLRTSSGGSFRLRRDSIENLSELHEIGGGEDTAAR